MNKFTFKEDIDEADWESFLRQIPHTPFTQNYVWGDFQKQLGKKVWRLGILADSSLVAILLLTKETSRFGSYLYSVDGPVALKWDFLPELKDYLHKLAVAESCSFVRLDPRIEASSHNEKFFDNAGFKYSRALFQVHHGWVLDLAKTEEELLYGMRKTTRYEIRAGEKEGVRIEISEDPGKVGEFSRLLSATAGRKGFKGHNFDYLKTQFELLSQKEQVKLIFAYAGDQLRAGGYFIFYGDTVTYLYGGSLNVGPKTSASYLLQWRSIQEAKKLGFKYYDFWGVIAEDNPKHPWYGITLFKKGFGGQILPYLNAQDLSVSSSYQLFRNMENLRRLKNRLKSGYWEI